MTPLPSTASPPRAETSTPNPVATSPGSIPRTADAGRGSGSRDRLQDLVRDVVVGMHGLDVVHVLQRLDQLQDRVGFLALDAHRRLRDVGDLRVEHGDLLTVERA